ncbi:xanthine dehydrogenase family protein subunit M [Hoeflea sp. WL0058]|uniref:Xanthine dehydrogenase family protein subunit M n=1 Tax=Flavimaribacter sediminis TaxID=2865987 RepID=A0AAE2ZQK0_9HYPH|nr:xanthine dehydrogenase family protein subunit M [Flavimaribacter sediminis]MBW8640199.1 xanthine dehydrogenase family protein subunit M [Flavimaribacter sediminis]
MKSFDYIRPATLEEAIAAGSQPGASYLAGGTNLLDLMKVDVARPDRIVDITRLPGLDRTEMHDDGTIRIGALVRNADLARDKAFAAACPAVAEALLSGASPQLRNAATVGGNLMQQTRCAYFYDPHSACNRRQQGTGCDALGGDTRNHAVLGWSDSCIATHPSDFCVPLTALDAVVEIEGPEGPRDAPLSRFYSLPDEAAPGGVDLAHGELITALRLPSDAASFAGHARYLKLRERTSYAFAIVSAAAMLRMEGGVIAEARIALGGVAARPWRSVIAEERLRDAAPSADLFVEAAEAVLQGAEPSGENAFKIELSKRLVIRALQRAAEGTPERMPALPASVFASDTGVSDHA